MELQKYSINLTVDSKTIEQRPSTSRKWKNGRCKSKHINKCIKCKWPEGLHQNGEVNTIY